ncbi:MAG: ABC transporter ATP-binding protein [Gemmatimonadales bacterium]|nr:ABC transporter ATP-binding protein [Gemmatimonadales bacterium]
MSMLLDIRDLDVAYGEAQALHAVTLSVAEGEIVAVVGANGAGKTTLLRTVSGLVRPESGSIRFAGEDIGKLPVHSIVGRGISHIPEGRGVLATLSVRDNLRVGCYLTGKAGERRMEQVREWFPVLFERLAQPAGMLSGGEQQMLAIGRRLLVHPRLLMIDELSLGLSPKITAQLMPRLQDIRAGGTSVVLVDQSMHLAMRIADRLYILANGRVAWSGPPGDLEGDRQLMDKYLGMD